MNGLNKHYNIVIDSLSPEEYFDIRKTTGWDELSLETIEKGLKNSLYTICIYDKKSIVAMGRVIGDGSIYFYVQDVIVIPKYKGNGLGRIVMEHIMNYLKNHANENSFIGLMAADEVETFYHKFGFKTRGNNKPGMYLTINKDYSNFT